MQLEFSAQVFEGSSKNNLIKIRQVGAELFHAFGRTDRRDETNTLFSQFCKSP